MVSNSRSGKAYIYLSYPPDNRKNLFLFGAIQGLYDPVLNTEIPDTIKGLSEKFNLPLCKS
ncbi:MAG: hypothetical protein IPI04_04340 [Ignavibacteria bacterium]|nr:hypothetical protein [Ignavibacteria bacterium]